jgi:hypothetical protein
MKMKVQLGKNGLRGAIDETISAHSKAERSAWRRLAVPH